MLCNPSKVHKGKDKGKGKGKGKGKDKVHLRTGDKEGE
jgi:hypothetical protein